jgi:predicted DNA binding CopG/RHH family protein
MRDEYDFSKGTKNPYAKAAKATVTIRLDKATVEYFKGLSAQVNMPYQTLINSYLADCAAKKITPEIIWSGLP